MPVRSKRLAAVTAAAGVGVTVYTAPPGETAIVKDIRLWSAFGPLSRVILSLASGPDAYAIVDRAFTNLETVERQGFMVLNPGDRLEVLSLGGALRVWVSGAELEGVAD